MFCFGFLSLELLAVLFFTEPLAVKVVEFAADFASFELKCF